MKLLFYSSSFKNMIRKNPVSYSWMIPLVSMCIMALGFSTKSFSQDIIINEINYEYDEPFRGYNAKDWVELYNRSANAVDMSGWVLADEDTLYTFQSGVVMPPNSYYIVAKDAVDFLDAHPGTGNVFESDLSFSSSGETIALYQDSLVTLEDLVTYGDDTPWPDTPDGEGPTLSLADPTLDNDIASNWFGSGNYGGSPGQPNSIFCNVAPPKIVINEINYKSVAFVNPKDWIELHNPNNFPVDISGWEFADEKGFFRVPVGVSIPAGGYHVLTQTSSSFSAIFGVPHTGDWGWGLDGGGEDIGLFTENRCLVDKVDYDDDLPWPDDTDSTGFTITLIDPGLNNNLPGSWISSSQIGVIFGTPGQPNNVPDPCSPTPDRIIINEINYNSDTILSPGNWVELYNPGATAVDLSDWRYYDEDSLYVIPSGTTIPPDGYLVLTEDDVRFSTAFPAVSNYVGPMGFGLSNNRERIILYTPNQCIVDSLKYNDKNPWPDAPDGEGPTLSLLDPSLDNTNPYSWAHSPANGTPGAANTFCTDIELSVFLQGPYNPLTDEMDNQLNVDHGVLPGQTPANPNIAATPAIQPYGIAPWSYMGTEGTGFTDDNYSGKILDWVMVSFRTGVDKSTEVSRSAALVKKSGEITMVNRCAISDQVTTPVYAVVEHRNHAGVMSHQPITIANSRMDYDFRVQESYVGPDPANPIGAGQAVIGTGVYGMYAGDGDQSGDAFSYDITGNDKTIWTMQNGQFGQYLEADYDMDGDVNGNDKLIWSPNNGTSSRVPR